MTIPSLPRGITQPSTGGYRVRLMRQGVWHTLPVTETLAEAVAAMEALKETLGPRGKRPRSLPTGWDREVDHSRQRVALGRGVSLRNIHRTGFGYTVKLTREHGQIYGGHFTGPDALAAAVARRDELEDLHPKTR